MNTVTAFLVVVILGVAAYFFLKPSPKPTAASISVTSSAPAASPPAADPPVNVFVGTEASLNEALLLYPSLNEKGSPLQTKFAERVKHLKANQPAYFEDKSWPLKLANEVAK